MSGGPSQADRASRFLELHAPGRPLLMANAWDAGTARLLASLGFAALATTSSGFAATLGRPDGAVGRDAALSHAAALAAAVPVPVSADLENGFADAPEAVARTAAGAVAAGLAGFSIEDFTGDDADPIYEREHAAERVRAAVEVAHAGPARLVVTARAENYLHGRPDLADTIARLQAYQAAGADVLFAPAADTPEAIATIIAAVDRPVSVLARASTPAVAQLAELGVSRISVGGAFAWVAYDALATAAIELRDQGTYAYTERSAAGAKAAQAAFRPA